MQPTIAIDGMGGDAAPDCVVRGLSEAALRVPLLKFKVFGDKNRIAPLVRKYLNLKGRVNIVHTPEVVTNTLKLKDALRLKNSSMRLALESVRDGTCAAVVSAGNTGAYLALAKMALKTVEGIERPAIVSQIPTKKGESIFLDLGGNIACTSDNLVDFALMGRVYAQQMLFKSEPTVGLLNVGAESTKGPTFLHEAFEKLSGRMPGFHGFIEGDDVMQGTVDVIVTDGYAGNIALKMGEGVIDFFMDALKRSLRHGLRGKLAYFVAKPLLRALSAQLDPRKYNGALWLGLDGIAVKSHGGTDAFGFSHAIEVAYDVYKNDLAGKIKADISEFQAKIRQQAS